MGNFLVATAKSEDGFRKAQQLTEEATETPQGKNAAAFCGSKSPEGRTEGRSPRNHQRT